MQINRENIDALNIILTVQIVPADYTEKFNKSIKKVGKEISLPGFRKGHVPEGLVRKQYWKRVLIDEVNGLVNDEINKYLTDNHIEYLGQPIAQNAWDEELQLGNEMTFKFELGLNPSFDINFSELKDVEMAKIQVDEQMIDELVNARRQKFGKESSVDVSTEQSVIEVFLHELDVSGGLLVGGYYTTTAFQIMQLPDALRTRFIGIKAGENVVLQLSELPEWISTKMFKEESTKGLMRREDRAFEFKIHRVLINENAELDEAFFKLCYPSKEIKTLEELRETISQEAQAYLEHEANRGFFANVEKKLLETVQIELPEAFLKKWLFGKAENENELKNMEEQFPEWLLHTKKTLLLEKIRKVHHIDVSLEEVKSEIRSIYGRNSGTQDDEHNSAQIDRIVDSFMRDEKEVTQFRERKIMEKIHQVYLKEVTPTIKIITKEKETTAIS